MSNKFHCNFYVIIMIVSTEAAAQSITLPGITSVNNRNLFHLYMRTYALQCLTGKMDNNNITKYEAIYYCSFKINALLVSYGRVHKKLTFGNYSTILYCS